MGILFRRNIDPRCIYCTKSTPLDDKEVACVKKGIVGAYEHCRSFKYDPLKRVPPKPVKLRQDYQKEDFVI